MASITPYRYAFNDPISFSDPTGLRPGLGDGPGQIPEWAQFGFDNPGDFYNSYGGGMSESDLGIGRTSPGSGMHWTDKYREANDPFWSSTALYSNFGSLEFYNSMEK
ncbi:MAG: hypothetical protein RIG77_11035 [Cyclobacteriaceae bacterium]